MTARHREDTIILSWEFPREREKEIDRFVIMRSSGGAFERFGTASRSDRTFSDSFFKTGEQYRYKVLSQNFRGILSNASLVVITPSPLPGPPRRISTLLAGDSLEVTWGDVGQGVLYNIYRRFDEETYPPMPLNASPLTSAAFRDLFFADRVVHYTIRSLTATLDEGEPSEEITVDASRFVPPAPSGLRCFSETGLTYLYWNVPDTPWIRGFKIYRSSDSGDYALIGETQIPFFLDTSGPGRKRGYRITALGPRSEGPAAEVRGDCASAQ